ncbi:alpha/beta-hydrolase family protein [Smaragdicoccus niigatensis]|uniref:alpha/beta-hydrolase family protein n=1 Tax=Smaragdicoccus niigatensis TaxID=359359 RepID=UPI00036B99FF|nr:alpha/beta-hydrolase family protein [Smaragdicoccus niigatensis]
MIRLPSAGASIGFCAGAVVAFYPNEFARGTLTECLVILIFGTIGFLMTRRSLRSWSASRTALIAIGVTTCGFAMWLWWQNELRAVSGQDVVAVGSAAVVWSVAALTPVVLSSLPLRKALVVVVAALVGLGNWSGVATAQRAPGEVFAGIESSARGLRVYEPLTDEPVTHRTDRAVHRLVDSGGLDMRAIVVALPTGSGWVDARFVRSTEEAVDGKVAILAVQYTQMRSWLAYLFERSAVEDVSVAIVDSLDRLLPRNHPPIYFYGQSLGALGVRAAAVHARDIGFPIAGSLLVGPPGGVGDRGSASLVNSSDPVVTWSPTLLVVPSSPPTGCVIEGGRSPRAPWLPVVTFLQTSVDLLLATDNPPGFGHRYDERQGVALLGGQPQKLPWTTASSCSRVGW